MGLGCEMRQEWHSHKIRTSFFVHESVLNTDLLCLWLSSRMVWLQQGHSSLGLQSTKQDFAFLLWSGERGKKKICFVLMAVLVKNAITTEFLKNLLVAHKFDICIINAIFVGFCPGESKVQWRYC